jgi:uncharacterized membrane protein
VEAMVMTILWSVVIVVLVVALLQAADDDNLEGDT